MKKRKGIRTTLLAGLAAVGMLGAAAPAQAQSLGDELKDIGEELIEQSIRGTADEIFRNGQEARDYNRAVRSCARLNKVPEFDRRGRSTTNTRNTNRRGTRNSTTTDYQNYECVWPEDHSSNQRRVNRGHDSRYSDVDRYYNGQRRLDETRARAGVGDPLLRAELLELERRRLDLEERRVEERVPDATITVVQSAPAESTQRKLSVTEQQFLAMQDICIAATVAEKPNQAYNTTVSECNARVGATHTIKR